MIKIIIANRRFTANNVCIANGARMSIISPKRFLITMGIITVLLAALLSIFMAKIIVGIDGDYVSTETYNAMKNEYDVKIAMMRNDLKETNMIVAEKDTTIAYLEQQQVELVNQYNNKIDSLKVKSMALAKKYWYIFKNYEDESTITFDDLDFLEVVCKENNINPHVVTNLWSLESKWNAKADNNKSTALGLGQFLKGTGKFVYGTLMNRSGVYRHEVMAKDPKINTEMTVEYLTYLLKNNKGNIKQSLINYNGNELGPKYYSIINSKMKSAGLGGIENTKYYNNKFNTVM